jgi:tetratricopeptide (TPR) repeat protein/Zn-dependent protease
MQYLLYPIAFYALLLGIRYFIVMLRLNKLRFQYPKSEIQRAEQVPVHLKQLFQFPIQELRQFSFKPCSYLQVQSMLKLYPPTTYELLLYHSELKTYVKVSIRRPVEPIYLFDIEFYTFFNDRSLLLTMNGKAYGIVGVLPNAIVQDPYTAETSVQWQTHQNRLNQLVATKASIGLAPEAFTRALEAHTKVYIDCLVKAGKLAPLKEAELFQLKGLTILKTTHDVIQGSKKAASVIKQRRQQAKTNTSLQIEIPIELEVEGFQRMEQMQRGLVGRKFRTWLLLASLGLFIASYTSFFASHTLAIFMAVLILHEGGHLLAMKLFGYQDTSVLFVPFLGALATARKDDATLTQKFWISLAGPLPGLILGVGLAIANSDGTYPSWVQEASWMLIGLNLFNLLPVYPLDGGQIADLLLFSRHPYIGVCFKGMGVLLLALLGLFKPMLLGFAILIALTIPASFRSAKVNIKLQQELRKVSASKANDPAHFLQFIFQQLKQSGYGNLPFSTRYTLAKDLLHRQHESSAKWTTRLFLGLLYCGSLLGGMAGTLQAFIPGWTSLISEYGDASERLAHITEKKQQEVEQATVALQHNPNDVNAYMQRSQVRAWLRDTQGALADYDQVVRLKPNDTSSLLTRSGFRLQLKDYQGAIQDYNQVLRLNPKDERTYRLRAHVRSLLGDNKGAIADYNQMVKLNPKNIEAYLGRAGLQQQLRNYRSAIADVNAAIQLDSNLPEAYELRSQARRSLGDEKGAIADQQKAEALYRIADEEDPS